jgi:hypothetical protein
MVSGRSAQSSSSAIRSESIREDDDGLVAMKTLDEAWQWYENTRRQLKLIQRLGEHYWDEMPWGGELGKDDSFCLIAGQLIIQETTFGLAHLDGLAIVVLFSVFESLVRLHSTPSAFPESA